MYTRPNVGFRASPTSTRARSLCIRLQQEGWTCYRLPHHQPAEGIPFRGSIACSSRCFWCDPRRSRSLDRLACTQRRIHWHCSERAPSKNKGIIEFRHLMMTPFRPFGASSEISTDRKMKGPKLDDQLRAIIYRPALFDEIVGRL